MSILKRIKITYLLFLFGAVSICVSAQIPLNYYVSAEGKSGATLKTALYQIINPHTVLDYYDMWLYYPTTDCRPENTSVIWDMYSNNSTLFSERFGVMEREHCVPKSWWGGSTTDTHYSDLFNLYPSYGEANQEKLNYPLSEVASVVYDNGSCKVGTSIYSGYSDDAFEPADEYKGDFARTYFYMVTCYQNITTWETYSYCMFENTTYPTIKTWALNLLLEWHRNDSVSDKEISRNNAVYGFQNNRNPFVDYPELVEHVWGKDTTVVWNITNSTKNEAYKNFSIKNTLVSSYIEFSSEQIENRDIYYQIISPMGSVLLFGKLNASKIDVNNLPKGVYVLNVKDLTNNQTSINFIKN